MKREDARFLPDSDVILSVYKNTPGALARCVPVIYLVLISSSLHLSASVMGSVSQPPGDNGSKITNYLLEWDEVSLYPSFSVPVLHTVLVT